jgi:hypothetical protein
MKEHIVWVTGPQDHWTLNARDENVSALNKRKKKRLPKLRGPAPISEAKPVFMPDRRRDATKGS